MITPITSQTANFCGTSRYTRYPDHFIEDTRSASPEKGMRLREIQVQVLVEFIKAVKADTAVPALEKEFFERVKTMSEGNL